MLSDMYHIILVNYPFFLTPPLEFQSTRSNFRIYIYIPVHLTSEMKKNRRESREEGSIVSQGPLTSFQLLSPRPWPKRHFNRRRRPPPLVSKPPIKSKGESLVEFSDAVPLPLLLHQPGWRVTALCPWTVSACLETPSPIPRWTRRFACTWMSRGRERAIDPIIIETIRITVSRDIGR